MQEPKDEAQDGAGETLSAGIAERRAAELRVLTSEALFQGAREIIIRHSGEDYRLRLTRVGKLILNK